MNVESKASKESTMKSVTCSEVMRVRNGSCVLHAGASWHQMMVLGVTLLFGVPVIIMTFRLLDPGAPLGYIVFPVLAGSLAPVIAALPGRFEIKSRFDAHHLVGTLDATLDALGYAQAARLPGAVQYRTRQPKWHGFGRDDIEVTVREHGLEIVGPFATLCALKKRMAY
jgi:hypothetical protein